MLRTFLSAVCGALLAVASLVAGAQTPQRQPACTVGFDIGSSGIRVGSTADGRDGRVSIDYLGDLWAHGAIVATNDATVSALKTLADGTDCLAVAGAYSAWRLAVEREGAAHVADTLAALHRQSGVAIFVIPQAVEGSYGYYGARRLLGERLTTPYILDVGGGSLQIASRHGGWGTALGQKAWRKAFCAEAKGSADPSCAPNPVGEESIDQSRRILAREMADARATLGHGLRVTAVSSPVVRGIHPILAYLANGKRAIPGTVDATGFDRVALDAAIALMQRQDDDGIVALLDNCPVVGTAPVCQARFVATAVTDMLLVRTIMEGVGVERLEVAEADLTNVPGILADPRAAAWAGKYGCYLERLRRQGVDAYLSSSEGCR